MAGHAARFVDHNHSPALRARVTMMLTASTVAMTAAPITTVIADRGGLIKISTSAATAPVVTASPGSDLVSLPRLEFVGLVLLLTTGTPIPGAAWRV